MKKFLIAALLAVSGTAMADKLMALLMLTQLAT